MLTTENDLPSTEAAATAAEPEDSVLPERLVQELLGAIAAEPVSDTLRDLALNLELALSRAVQRK